LIYNEPILNSTTTTTITFRITKKYEDYLRKKAEQERVSINIIANRIFGEYIEWQQFVEKFGTIALSREAFFTLINVIDEQKISEVGAKIGQKMPKEFILFKWKEITYKNIVEFIKMFSDHCLNGDYDYTTTTDNKTVISIKHSMGIKGSIFLKSYFLSLIMETLQKQPNVEITDNSIILRF
jgi:hypothetical protein